MNSQLRNDRKPSREAEIRSVAFLNSGIGGESCDERRTTPPDATREDNGKGTAKSTALERHMTERRKQTDHIGSEKFSFIKPQISR
jgi:hypothetical protein